MQKQLKRKQRSQTKSGSSGLGRSGANSGQQSLLVAEKTSGSSRSGGPVRTKKGRTEVNNPALTASEFDRRFDSGESVFDLGVSKTGWTRPGLESRRFNVDVPAYLLEKLDHAAQLRGMTRQALVKSWLYDRLEGISPEV